jgi:hypothetical protein
MARLIHAEDRFLQKKKGRKTRAGPDIQRKKAESDDAGSKVVALPVKKPKRWSISLVESITRQCEAAEAKEARTGAAVSPEEILNDISRRGRARGNDDGDGNPPAA